MDPREAQLRAARVVLEAIGAEGFALAGASAIREHGLTDRPTMDVDIFGAATTGVDAFAAAVARAERALVEAGWSVERVDTFDLFVRVQARLADSRAFDIDFAVNWRMDSPVPGRLGPLLSERDVVAGKIGALYSRAEVRDFLDLDSIRQSSRYTDEDLLRLGHEQDEGFDRQMFAEQLSRVATIPVEAIAQYGVSFDEFRALQSRVMDWAVALRDPPDAVNNFQSETPLRIRIRSPRSTQDPGSEVGNLGPSR